MIYTSTRPEHGIRIGPIQGDPEEMPWFTYYRGLSTFGTRQERWTAQRIGSLSMWNRLHWEPQAAETVLRWIKTGQWGKRSSILFGAKGERL